MSSSTQSPVGISPGERVELQIGDLAYGGAGVARHHGFVILVDRALPGETITAEITRVTPRFALGNLVEVRSPSPHRRPAPCPHDALCGGCAYQSVEYPFQLAAKREQLKDLLERIGKIPSPPVSPMLAGIDSLHYRRRMSYEIPAAAGRGPGLHLRENPSQVLEVPECLLPERGIQVAYARVLEGLRAQKGPGRPRHLELQAGSRSVLPVALLRGGGSPSRELCKLATEWVQDDRVLEGVVWTPDDSPRRSASGGRLRLLAGRSAVEEDLAGFRLQIPAGSFFQANPTLAGKLFGEISERCGKVSKTVLELYAGVGALTLFLARGGRPVLAVEGNRESARAARENARLNGAGTIEWIEADVRRVLAQWSAEGRRFDSVVLDPPRSGLPADCAAALAALARDRILYLSCDPSTLARDLRLLMEKERWTLEEAVPADFFPQTAGIECLAVLRQAREV